MPTLMQRSAVWLGGRMKQAAGRSVVIRRGEFTSEAVTGWQDSKAFNEVGDDGLTTSVKYDVWTFIANELVLQGETLVPKPGDIIVEELDGTTYRYEVLPTAMEPCVTRFDTGHPQGLLILVNTKRIE